MAKSYFGVFYFMIALFNLISCSAPQKTATNYTHKTECVGIDLDGSQTVVAWANNNDRSNAIEQAKKNAVRDILFSGINSGQPDCGNKPVVLEVNAQANHEDYFIKFFENDGEYKNYALLKEYSNNQKITKEQIDQGFTSGFLIKVKRVELKQKMIADGILK